jgi:predicted HicB family RNase H-like nuclease
MISQKKRIAASQSNVAAPVEEYNGDIPLQVPKSLHRFLIEEAQAEGVCLDLLILAKISIPLYDMIMALKE